MIFTFHKHKDKLVTLLNGVVLLNDTDSAAIHAQTICNRLKTAMHAAVEDHESCFVTIVLTVTDSTKS